MISCLSGGFSRWLSYLWLMIEAHHLKCVLQWWKQNIWKCRTISCKFMIHVGSSSSQLGKSTWRKMAETLFCIKRDFFFNVPNKAKGKKNTGGGDAARTLLTKVIAFSNLGDMYQIALFLMQWSSAEILLWLLSLPSFNFRLFWRSRQRGYVIGHLVNAEEWNCVQSY